MKRHRLLAVALGVPVGLLVGLLAMKGFAGDPLADRPANVAAWGGPPQVPHGDYTEESCVRCHAQHKPIEGGHVPRVPHPERTSCRECHVPYRPDAPLREGSAPPRK